MMRNSAPVRRVVMLAAIGGMLALPLHAAVLYWGGTPVKTASVRSCMSFAVTAMRGVNMQNIRTSPSEVTGTNGGAYAAITCVATAPRATAIVMVTGNNNAETMRVRDQLKNKIAVIVNID